MVKRAAGERPRGVARLPKTTKAPAVKRSILVRAPREKAFEAFANVEILRLWYFDDAELDFREGGELKFDGPEGTIRATIETIVPNERIVMTYSPPWWGRVTWQLEDLPSGARVHLLHEGFEGHEEWLDRFAWGWEAFLKQLKGAVEGKPTR